MGVAVAMFLFCTVQAMQTGVIEATQVTANDTTLVVYRENRYCPFTSRLPQHYQRRIEGIPGVASVVPMRILVSNCRASLDVVTFRGVPPEEFLDHAALSIVDGSFDAWRSRGERRLVGESLARRRGVAWATADGGRRHGLRGRYRALRRTAGPQRRVHAPAVHPGGGQRGGTGGVVTQFNVKMTTPRSGGRRHRDRRGVRARSGADVTYAEKAFVARAASDVVELVNFASWLGWGALLAVFALVANAIVLAVQDRVRDHAILQTLGYPGSLLGRLIIAEGLVIGLCGGGLGAVVAFVVVSCGRFSLTMEGLNVEIASDPAIIVVGLVMSVALGVARRARAGVAGVAREIASCFRAV